MGTIFDNVRFMNEKSTEDENSSSYSIICESYEYIQDCSIFITEEMIEDCMGIKSLIEQSAILEGAKFDAWLTDRDKSKKNAAFKRDILKVIEMNKLEKDEIFTKRKEVFRIIKRIVAFIAGAVVAGVGGSIIGGGIGGGVIQAVGFIPGMVVSAALGLCVGLLIGKLLNRVMNEMEYAEIKKDSKEVIKLLRDGANKQKNKAAAKKMNQEADRLEKAIDEKKYK